MSGNPGPGWAERDLHIIEKEGPELSPCPVNIERPQLVQEGAGGRYRTTIKTQFPESPAGPSAFRVSTHVFDNSSLFCSQHWEHIIEPEKVPLWSLHSESWEHTPLWSLVSPSVVPRAAAPGSWLEIQHLSLLDLLSQSLHFSRTVWGSCTLEKHCWASPRLRTLFPSLHFLPHKYTPTHWDLDRVPSPWGPFFLRTLFFSPGHKCSLCNFRKWKKKNKTSQETITPNLTIQRWGCKYFSD